MRKVGIVGAGITECRGDGSRRPTGICSNKQRVASCEDAK